MPQNRRFEKALEEARGEDRIGTTMRAIGPTYAMKMLREGYRVCDLVGMGGELRKDAFWKKLQKDPLFDILERTYGVDLKKEGLSREKITEDYLKLVKPFRDRVTDTSSLIEEMIRQDLDMLFEAGQGAMLDIDMGTYPKVTSSNTGIGAVKTGTGVDVRPDRTILVVKAYTTRVGEGPFPTEEKGPLGDRLREAGGEYGSTTGRPRRCGWLDKVQLKHALRMSKPPKPVRGERVELAVTKLDVLGFDEIKAGTHYLYGAPPDAQVLYDFPPWIDVLEECKPVYKRFKGWSEDITGVDRLDDLPAQAREYMGWIEKELQVPISMVSNGPDRTQLIKLY